MIIPILGYEIFAMILEWTGNQTQILALFFRMDMPGLGT